MRGPPTHDFSDILMKQKVADSVLHRVVGNEANNGPQVGETHLFFSVLYLLNFCDVHVMMMFETNPSPHSFNTYTLHLLSSIDVRANETLNIFILGCPQTIQLTNWPLLRQSYWEHN